MKYTYKFEKIAGSKNAGSKQAGEVDPELR